MKYVAVLGTSHQSKISEVVLKYFDSFLATFAESTTGRNWSLVTVNKDVKKAFKHKEKLKKINPKVELYLDSGGFQIIVGYIPRKRVKEYIDVYHFILEKFRSDIDHIFSLDIMNRAWDKKTLVNLNDISINESIQLIKKYPEIKDKQLFVVQTRTQSIFELWEELMDKHNVYAHYQKYSFGGLVGLKKETRAQFSHFIPFLFWLLKKIEINNGEIKHLHLLGQSSKLAILTAVYLENLIEKKYNKKINITMDSSELMRFTKIEQKLPLILRAKNEYKFISNLDDLSKFSDKLVFCSKQDKENIKKGKVTNEIFVDFLSQNIANIINLAHILFDNLSLEELENYQNLNLEEIKKQSFIFEKGRLAQEFKNNLELIKDFSKIDDIDTIKNKCIQILKTY